MWHRSSLAITTGLLLCLSTSGAETVAGKAMTFETHIRPLFKAYCFRCHGEGKSLRGSLDLRLARFVKVGGDSGPAIVPGKASASLLVGRLERGEMPPGKVHLKAQEIKRIKRWIDQGARTAHPEPKELARGFQVTEEERTFWAFQPIRRPAVPQVRHAQQVSTPVDAFLLARLEPQGLSFSPQADRATLIRRVYFDLLGLPPTPEEVDAFLADDSPDAYERLVDRLLASPHYGERWGRHWLDVAGYADSEGYTNEDQVRADAYKYRDYVIHSLNADKPWDQFIREQLAGDEMVKGPYNDLGAEDREKLIATGFLRMAPDGTGSGGVDQPMARNQVIADTLQIVSTSLLGLTVQCAQCHNHRYDPIPQSDYYQLRAIFAPALDWKNWRAPAARRITLLSDADRRKGQQIEAEARKLDMQRLEKQKKYIAQTFEKQLAKLPEKDREAVRKAHDTPASKRTAEQKKLLQRYPSTNVTAGSLYLYNRQAANELKALSVRAGQLRKSKPTPTSFRTLTEVPGKIPITHVFTRGDYEQPGEVMQPAGLSILASLNLGEIPSKDPTLPTSGRRLAFARRLTSGKHPLVARVLVNRIWLHHFGRGIVASPADFGSLGDRPTHPELLDWLADEFMRGGWELKRLHRLILTSTAYRQSSRQTPELRQADPDNYLLGRFSLHRLEAEELRDAILAVSGTLNRQRFGTPVPVTVDQEGQVILGVDTRDNAGRFTGKSVSLGGQEFRRSIYIQARRSMPLAVLDTFDAPVMSPNCEVRNTSTVAPQSLLLMNSTFIWDHASRLADRLQSEAGPDLRAQVDLGWRLVFGVEPTPEEVSAALNFLGDQTANFKERAPAGKKGTAPAKQALASFCQALLNSNRFLYVD